VIGDLGGEPRLHGRPHEDSDQLSDRYREVETVDAYSDDVRRADDAESKAAQLQVMRESSLGSDPGCSVSTCNALQTASTTHIERHEIGSEDRAKEVQTRGSDGDSDVTDNVGCQIGRLQRAAGQDQCRVADRIVRMTLTFRIMTNPKA
jgi:hypothetical protein